MLPNLPGPRSKRWPRRVGAPSENVCSTPDTSSVGGLRGHGRTGLPCRGLMSGEYSEVETRPWIGSDHWWGFDEPMGAAKGQRT
jgi:hypothetical protein